MGPTKAMNPVGRGPRPRRPFAREQIIADALVDVASELRLTDAAELMSMILNDHAANIADLVNSSTELFFKSGTLRYALSASFTAPWDATPIVEIDMEFRHAAVCAFFRLKIGQRRAGVEIIDILFDEQGLDELVKAERLSAALDSARLRVPLVPSRGKPHARRAAQGRSSLPAGVASKLSSIYLFEIASQKAQWLSARQTAIAGNVANANTPGYRALDIQPFSAVLDSSPIEMASTNPAHLSSPQSQAGALRQIEVEPAEQTLSGNTVNLEQQMINLGDVNRDYTMSANIRRAFHQLLLSALK